IEPVATFQTHKQESVWRKHINKAKAGPTNLVLFILILFRERDVQVTADVLHVEGSESCRQERVDKRAWIKPNLFQVPVISFTLPMCQSGSVKEAADAVHGDRCPSQAGVARSGWNTPRGTLATVAAHPDTDPSGNTKKKGAAPPAASTA